MASWHFCHILGWSLFANEIDEWNFKFLFRNTNEYPNELIMIYFQIVNNALMIWGGVCLFIEWCIWVQNNRRKWYTTVIHLRLLRTLCAFMRSLSSEMCVVKNILGSSRFRSAWLNSAQLGSTRLGLCKMTKTLTHSPTRSHVHFFVSSHVGTSIQELNNTDGRSSVCCDNNRANCRSDSVKCTLLQSLVCEGALSEMHYTHTHWALCNVHTTLTRLSILKACDCLNAIV